MTTAILHQGAPGLSSAMSAAGTSSFYAAMRILPAPQREAMFHVYAFCRAVDDIADSVKPRAQRLAELARWREDIAGLFCRREVPERLQQLASVIRQYGCEHEDFDAIIAGMLMDAERDICAPDWATLDLYCDRVASAVGRISVRIFNLPQAQGRPLAHHLGRALQLTNILRDLDEDAAIGRLYLPREALSAAGILDVEPRAALAHPGLGQACAPVMARARQHFVQAQKIMAGCPHPAARSPRLMACVYSDVLRRMERRGFAAPRRRIRVGKTRLLLMALRHGVF